PIGARPMTRQSPLITYSKKGVITASGTSVEARCRPVGTLDLAADPCGQVIRGGALACKLACAALEYRSNGPTRHKCRLNRHLAQDDRIDHHVCLAQGGIEP